MQAEDGEFYLEKKLDFKIPKKTSNTSDSSDFQNQSTLADLYYNYPYQSAYPLYSPLYGNVSGQDAAWNNYSISPLVNPVYGNPGVYDPNQNPSSSSGFAPPPPPGVDDTAIKIFDALKDIKEKPKTYKVNIFQQTVPDLLDDSLPKELKANFQPLFCKLCSAKLSSNQTAKMHYKSKNHEKKVRKWLVEWSQRTGEPLPQRALPNSSSAKKNAEAEKNPAWFHCDVCDLDLTGRLHAESHYMGRNHQKAMLGHKAPAGSGYYNSEGKWVRTKGQKSKNYNFEKGEDNFGLSFQLQRTKPVESAGNTYEVVAPPIPIYSEPPAKKKKVEPSKFHCNICNINATNQEQLNIHFKGQKHAKKLKALGMDAYLEHRKLIEAAASIVSDPVPIQVVEQHIDLAVYRTPSGDYYCPTCNCTSTSELQFMQHMKCKSHLKKAAQQK